MNTVAQRTKSDQHLSTGSLQLSGLIIRGHAMLSHEGLPPERETLEYAWQMEILLGKISARMTMIQVLALLENQRREDAPLGFSIPRWRNCFAS